MGLFGVRGPLHLLALSSIYVCAYVYVYVHVSVNERESTIVSLGVGPTSQALEFPPLSQSRSKNHDPPLSTCQELQNTPRVTCLSQ